MLNGKIKKILNKNNEYMFPITSSNAVFMEDGSTKLTDKLKERYYSINSFKRQAVETVDTPRINRAISYVNENGGGTILFPKGIYILSNETIVCLPNVTLMGANDFLGKDTSSYAQFNCYATDKPQFLLREYCKMKNFSFYYPEQVEATATSPTVYGWTIDTDVTKINDDIQLENLYMINPYKAINLYNAGRFNMKNIYGQPIYKGLVIDDIFDISSIDRVEFWTYHYNVGTNMYNYILNNATAFEFKKIDGGLYSNLFCYGYKKGYLFSDGTWATFVGCCADKCYAPITVDDCNMIEILGGSYIGSSFDSKIVTINNISNVFKISNINMFGGCSIGVLNKSNNGEFISENCFIKRVDDKINIPYLLEGTGKNSINTNLDIPLVVNSNTYLNGIKMKNSGNDVGLIFTLEDTNGLVSSITNGYSINLGSVTVSDKIVKLYSRIDDNANVPCGIYCLNFDLKTVCPTNPNKRFYVEILSDTGSPVYNALIGDLPMTSNSNIKIPFYLGSKPYITQIRFLISNYNTDTQNSDHIEITNIKLEKISNASYSLMDLLYSKTFNDINSVGVDYAIR